MQYLIKAYIENGDTSSNYALWGGLEAYRRGVTLTIKWKN